MVEIFFFFHLIFDDYFILFYFFPLKRLPHELFLHSEHRPTLDKEGDKHIERSRIDQISILPRIHSR